MIGSPKYFHITGNGELISNDQRFKVDFEIFLINQQSVIYCKTDFNPAVSVLNRGFEDWSLKGYTNSKEYVFATDLTITEFINNFIELVSNNNIIIGDYFNVFADKIEYPINNLYET